MKLSKAILLSVVMQLTILMCFSNAYSLDFTLKSKIQTELDSNPFLKEQKIKLLVEKEDNGYVNIKILEGNSNLRKQLNKGVDVLGPEYEARTLLLGSGEQEKKSVTALRKSIEYVKKMNGVKEVMLSAEVNTNEDKAEELVKQAQEARGKKEFDKSTELLTKADSLGSFEASNLLGLHYLNGKGVTQDKEKGLYFLTKAAENGSRGAPANLGMFYFEGKYLPLDEKKAAYWLQKAADQNIDMGLIYDYLGWLYENGAGGLPKDKELSKKWSNIAAEMYERYIKNGNKEFSYNLGRLYQFGRGPEQDYNKAIDLFKSADTLNNIMYFEVTCSNQKYNKCKTNLEKISKPVIDKNTSYSFYALLSATYACNGQFDKAVEFQKKAIETYSGENSRVKVKLNKQLELYSQNKPYIDNDEF